jgi:hypothetical protein
VYGGEGRKNPKITKDLFKRWEDCPEAVGKLDKLCSKLKGGIPNNGQRT